MDKKYIKLVKEIEEAVKAGDNELVHSLCDELLKNIVRVYEPDLLAEIEKITEDVDFWYA